MKEIGEPEALFNPKTVALIGASEKEGSVGRAVLENLILFKDRRCDRAHAKRQS